MANIEVNEVVLVGWDKIHGTVMEKHGTQTGDRAIIQIADHFDPCKLLFVHLNLMEAF